MTNGTQHISDLPSLTTPRLLLRKMREDDSADVFRYASDPEVSRYTTWETHESIDSSRSFLKAVVEGYATGTTRQWAIVLNDNERMVGTIGFGWWDDSSRQAEVGYALARDCWGQGFTPEALAAVMRYGFEHLNLNRIQARCHGQNTASVRVLMKSGFRHEGTFRENMLRHGVLADTMFFAILRREWLVHDAASD